MTSGTGPSVRTCRRWWNTNRICWCSVKAFCPFLILLLLLLLLLRCPSDYRVSCSWICDITPAQPRRRERFFLNSVPAAVTSTIISPSPVPHCPHYAPLSVRKTDPTKYHVGPDITRKGAQNVPVTSSNNYDNLIAFCFRSLSCVSVWPVL